MFLRNKVVIIILLILGVGSYYAYRHQYPTTKDDNFFEETLEKVIQDEIGFDVDLTPATEE